MMSILKNYTTVFKPHPQPLSKGEGSKCHVKTKELIYAVLILINVCFSTSKLSSQTAIQQSQAVFDYLKTNHTEKIDALFDTLGFGKLIKAMQTDAYKKELAVLGKPKKLLASPATGFCFLGKKCPRR